MNPLNLSEIFTQKPARKWYEQSGFSEPMSFQTYQRLKRLLDLAVALAILPIVLPIIGICGLLVKIDSPGPIFFTQRRTGKAGQRFNLYKLRTMVANAEEMKKALSHLNQMSGPDFKILDDPRVTRFGRFLRKSSLDELPQIFNVLKGEMSLVGPRPTSFSAETYSLWHTARLEVKPGITGLWQISGRSEVDFDDRIRLDIAYIQNQSMSLDLKILLRTALIVLSGRGAH